MGYMEDNAKKLNEALQRQFTSDLTWGMTREIATWAEKVALLEERILGCAAVRGEQSETEGDCR